MYPVITYLVVGPNKETFFYPAISCVNFYNESIFSAANIKSLELTVVTSFGTLQYDNTTHAHPHPAKLRHQSGAQSALPHYGQ